MRRGIRTGFTQPRRTVERAIADVRAQIEQPAATTPLLAPFRSMPQSFPADRRIALEARGRDRSWRRRCARHSGRCCSS